MLYDPCRAGRGSEAASSLVRASPRRGPSQRHASTFVLPPLSDPGSHCLLEGVPCILADIRGSRWQVYPSLRVAALVHALCSVLWALLHLHTFTPARALVPSHSFSVAFSKTTCLRLSRLLVFAACTFRLRQVANNHAFRSFFPTLLPNILIELPLGRIFPIWA